MTIEDAIAQMIDNECLPGVTVRVDHTCVPPFIAVRRPSSYGMVNLMVTDCVVYVACLDFDNSINIDLGNPNATEMIVRAVKDRLGPARRRKWLGPTPKST